jgi:23S rRNA (cytosine1962-C5)-methyltransferase
VQRHPWIFSGAIASRPDHAPGDILPVYSFDGKILGSGYFHPENSIAGRMITFTAENPLEAIRQNLKAALDLRNTFVPSEARRLVNAEGDGLPGLIIDQYGDVIVMQIHTAVWKNLKTFSLMSLCGYLSPKQSIRSALLQRAARKDLKMPKDFFMVLKLLKSRLLNMEFLILFQF